MAENLIVGKHYPALDGLRALAIILVLWWHSSAWAYGISSISDGNSLIDMYSMLSILGSSGVTLFFLISGFLITGILIDTSNDPGCLKKFYIRRSLRIFPLYYLALFLILLLSIFYIPQYEINTNFLNYIFYTQNWISIFDPSYEPFSDNRFLTHFWSLAIEEQYYLVWPAFFLFLYRKFSPRCIVLVIICLVFLSTLLRSYMMVSGSYSWQIPYTWTITRLDALLIGGLLAYAINQNFKIIDTLGKISIVILPLLFCFILIVLFGRKFYDVYVINVLFILTLSVAFYSFLLLSSLKLGHKTVAGKLLRNSFLSNIAKVSYGIYIFHVPILIVMQGYLEKQELNFWTNHFLLFFGGGLLSYILSYLIYTYFEKPILRLKDKYADYDNRG